MYVFYHIYLKSLMRPSIEAIYSGFLVICTGKLFDHYLYPRPAAAAAAKSLQLCLTLCDPTDGSPPGSPVPGILQARTLEWVVISFSSA